MKMDRRNFLAFIPSLSAIPFIGKDITKTESGILIAEPKPHVIQKPTSGNMNPLDLEVRLFANGKHVGNAFIKSFNMRSEPIQNLIGTCYENSAIAFTPMEMDIECMVIDPDQLLKGIYGK